MAAIIVSGVNVDPCKLDWQHVLRAKPSTQSWDANLIRLMSIGSRLSPRMRTALSRAAYAVDVGAMTTQ